MMRRLRVLRWWSRWNRKQRLAKPGRYYGDGGTIHHTTALDVEVCDGEVVAVWFRCQPLAFRQSNTRPERAAEMRRMTAEGGGAPLSGVEVIG